MLGRLVVTKYPDIAEELMPYAKAPVSEDLDRIPHYFDQFCKMVKLEPGSLKGVRYDREKVKLRGIFICAMLHIYNKNLYYLSETMPMMRNGFVNAISDCTGVHNSRVSLQIRQALFDETVYEEDKNLIQEVINKLSKTAG